MGSDSIGPGRIVTLKLSFQAGQLRSELYLTCARGTLPSGTNIAAGEIE